MFKILDHTKYKPTSAFTNNPLNWKLSLAIERDNDIIYEYCSENNSNTIISKTSKEQFNEWFIKTPSYRPYLPCEVTKGMILVGSHTSSEYVVFGIKGETLYIINEYGCKYTALIKDAVCLYKHKDGTPFGVEVKD